MIQKQRKEKKEESKSNLESDTSQNNLMEYRNRNFMFYCVNMMTLLDVDNYFKEEDKEGNDNNISLSCHIEKKNPNEIYYYKYTNISRNKIDIRTNTFYFNCCDNKCRALSLLHLNDESIDINSGSFLPIQEHSIPYERHSYVINPSKGNKFYNKIMMDNSLLNNLQLIKFTKYFINMAYLDYFFKEQYKYDLKHTFGKKKEKKLLNKKMKDSKDNKDNNTIISENKSKKSVNVIQKVKKNNQPCEKQNSNNNIKKKGEIIEIIDDDI